MTKCKTSKQEIESLERFLLSLYLRFDENSETTFKKDDGNIFIGIMHSGGCYYPSGIISVDQNRYHGSKNTILQAAYEELRDYEVEKMTDKEIKEAERDARHYDMNFYDYITEGFDGEAFSVSFDDFKNLYENTEVGKKLQQICKNTFKFEI